MRKAELISEMRYEMQNDFLTIKSLSNKVERKRIHVLYCLLNFFALKIEWKRGC